MTHSCSDICEVCDSAKTCSTSEDLCPKCHDASRELNIIWTDGEPRYCDPGKLLFRFEAIIKILRLRLNLETMPLIA